MGFIDRLYVAWRVLCGHAVSVDTRFYSAGDHEMTVTFYGRKLAKETR